MTALYRDTALFRPHHWRIPPSRQTILTALYRYTALLRPPYWGTSTASSCVTYQVFRYDGSGPVVKRDVAVLWDAVWQPAGQGVYPDRPASPGRKGPTAAEAAAGEQKRRPCPSHPSQCKVRRMVRYGEVCTGFFVTLFAWGGAM